MFKSIYKKSVFTVLFVTLFITLILFKNDINSKVIVLMLGVSLFYFNKKNIKISIQRHYPLLVFFLFITLSLSYSSNLIYGLNKVERLLLIPASILMFSSINKKDINFEFVSIGYVIVVLFAAFYSHTIVIIDFLSNHESSYKSFFNLNYSYKALANTINLHTTYYSYYILTAIILLLQFIKHKKVNLILKTIALACILYLSFFIVHLSSRIAIAMLYIIIMINIIQHMVSHKKLLRGIVTLTLFHVISFIIIMNVGVTKYRFQHLLGFTYYTGYTVNDSDHKIQLWSAAINANDNVLLGNGVGDIQSSLNKQYVISDLKKPLELEYNSHNQYLEYYVGYGIIGLILFLYIFYYYGRFFIQHKNFIGIQFLIITLIISLTECLWNRHNGIVFIVFVLLLLYKYNYEVENNLSLE